MAPTTLRGLTGNIRPDPRFFCLADGTTGLLLERTGDIFLVDQVPEPATLLLVLPALGLMGRARARSRSH